MYLSARDIKRRLLHTLRLRGKKLSGGELNPGLPRDRRGYSPLYYRRYAWLLHVAFGYYRLFIHNFFEMPSNKYSQEFDTY
jgi:hypothetical protein